MSNLVGDSFLAFSLMLLGIGLGMRISKRMYFEEKAKAQKESSNLKRQIKEMKRASNNNDIAGRA